MNKLIKRVFIVVLLLCLTITPVGHISAATQQEITPYYNNVTSASSNATINSDGLLTIAYRYTGTSGITTKAVITTYVEKKGFLGLFWSRVDIGTTDDEWVTTVNNYKYTGSRTYQLSKSGTYRVTIEYTIYGTGGAADVITHQKEASY